VHSPHLWKSIVTFHFLKINGTVTNLFISFDALHMLEYMGQPCNPSPDYKYDLCISEQIDRMNMEQYQCTSPWDLGLNNICTNKTSSKMVFETYEEFAGLATGKCSQPCSYLAVKLEEINREVVETRNKVYFRMDELVTVLRSHYIYSELSLIAKIGGYVGLFLGVSMFQVSGLVKAFLAMLTQWYRQSWNHY